MLRMVTVLVGATRAVASSCYKHGCRDSFTCACLVRQNFTGIHNMYEETAPRRELQCRTVAHCKKEGGAATKVSNEEVWGSDFSIR
jgi:hypothetical protein